MNFGTGTPVRKPVAEESDEGEGYVIFIHFMYKTVVVDTVKGLVCVEEDCQGGGVGSSSC